MVELITVFCILNLMEVLQTSQEDRLISLVLLIVEIYI
nr:MAG TPA: hypothetical protein [Bacteriophage sp.]